MTSKKIYESASLSKSLEVWSSKENDWVYEFIPYNKS